MRSIVQVVVGALLVLVGVDLGLRRISPLPPAPLEVDDGVAVLSGSDPQTILLGSSQTRSFRPLRDQLARESGGAQQMVLVPIEWGTFSSYRWVLEHRLAPLLDERDASGAKVRKRLKRALVITEFYDSCRRLEVIPNLPARAWTITDFFADVWREGLTGFNRNYVQRHWYRLAPRSPLIHDRNNPHVVQALRATVRPSGRVRERDETVEHLHVAMANLYPRCNHPEEIRDLEATIDQLIARGLEVTLVIFPKLPATVNPERDAVKLFDGYARDLARRKGIRLVDMALSAPLDPDDYQFDLEHLTETGNRKLSSWALDNGLSFLREVRP